LFPLRRTGLYGEFAAAVELAKEQLVYYIYFIVNRKL